MFRFLPHLRLGFFLVLALCPAAAQPPPAVQPPAEADQLVVASAVGVTQITPADPVPGEAVTPPAAQSTTVPTITPAPIEPTTGSSPRPIPLPLIGLGALILVAGGIGLGVLLSRQPGDRPATPAAAPTDAASPTAGPVLDAQPAFAAAAPANAAMAPDTMAAAGPVMLGGRVATSVTYDAAQNPSFTAILSARYDGAGPQDRIVASLWKGRAKVGDCGGGVPPLPAAGSYRCELDRLPPGAYKFYAGFPGLRPSTYRFNLVTKVTQSPPPRPADTITQADWIRRPTAEDVSRFYPNRAMLRDVEGTTRISCRVSVTGQLVGCEVQFESPQGYGFGAAAIRLSSTLRMRPMMRNGEPVDGDTITIPIRWQLQ